MLEFRIPHGHRAELEAKCESRFFDPNKLNIEARGRCSGKLRQAWLILKDQLRARTPKRYEEEQIKPRFERLSEENSPQKKQFGKSLTPGETHWDERIVLKESEEVRNRA